MVLIGIDRGCAPQPSHLRSAHNQYIHSYQNPCRRAAATQGAILHVKCSGAFEKINLKLILDRTLKISQFSIFCHAGNHQHRTIFSKGRTADQAMFKMEEGSDQTFLSLSRFYQLISEMHSFINFLKKPRFCYRIYPFHHSFLN